MLQTIQTLLLDFLEASLMTGVKRDLQIQSIPGKATICIGVRRCGKSVYLFQIMAALIAQGVARENILYLNFFDDRLHELKHTELTQIIEAYYLLYPEKKSTEKIFCFFDEIQMLPEWESFVDRLLRTENCEIYITGSSAKMLSKEMATQMRGRALSWELFPFSFREYLTAQGLDFTNVFSTKKRLLIQKSFGNYWESGGFPEVMGHEKMLRIKIHQEYYQTILFRDIVERHDISHPAAVMDLAYKLIDSIGSLYSLNSLTGYLQSLGHKVPKTAVTNYVAWLEDAYFLFSVRLFDASLSRSNANPKKIYCIDHSFVVSISSGILLNAGHLLENLVFVALRRVSSKIYYYKTKNGREVDFLVQLQNRSKILIQVCETLANESTKKREISAILEALTETKLALGIIVTRSEDSEIEIDGKTIRIIPIWRYLLEPYLTQL